MPFPPVTPDLLRALEDAVGKAHVATSREDLEPLGRDETEDLHAWPEAAVVPASTEEVSRVLALATRFRVPVVPRGAGTGLSGGAIPVAGGIVVSTKRLDRIVEIDEQELVAVVEPGVVTERLQDAVEAKGLFYPPDPASRGSCSIGGNVAENAGGPRCVKYGVTKDWVLGLEAVLASGETIHAGGKLRKDVTGYDLTRLIIGSEGTLALVTRVVLELIPYPEHRRTLVAPFPTVDAAARAVARVFRARVTPCACELLARAALEAVATRLGSAFPAEAQGADACLLLEVDGTDGDAVERDFLKLGEACLAAGADDVLVAATPERARELWKIRRSVGECVKRLGAYRELDVAVPRTRIPDALRAVDEVTAPLGLRAVSYGHAGDGNLHVNLLRGDLAEDAWKERRDRAARGVIEQVVALGGTISGEHGIGIVQRELVSLQLGSAELRLLRGIKAAFDPLGILNPGKAFPAA